MTDLPAPQPTPMMAQYLAIRAANPGTLLFYRMGDFYEMFFGDAEQAAACLDIALTRRGEHDGQPIPMCGVPVHAAESYLSRLIRRGFRVAMVEQMEDPKARTGKAPLKRAMVRHVVCRQEASFNVLFFRRPPCQTLLIHPVPWVPPTQAARPEKARRKIW